MMRVENVSFSYKNVQALKNVTLSIINKELLFVLGPNGSGKSTLLKCLARILKPEGVVYVNGREISEFPPNDYAKFVAYVPQRSEMSFLTVFDFVLLGRKPHFGWRARGEDVKVVKEVLKLLNLEDLSFKKLNELSGGELQRAAIARALAQDPKILLLDEPTNNLDIKNQIGFLNILRKIVRERNLSAVITTHDLNLAARYADRIVMMKSGEIYAIGGVDVLNEKNIKDVYGIDVEIVRMNGRVLVLPK